MGEVGQELFDALLFAGEYSSHYPKKDISTACLLLRATS